MSSVEYYTPGTAQWVPSSNGNWPHNAVESGSDGGAMLYVARAHFQGGLLPGKFHSGHRVCYIAWGGKEHAVTSSYEVLTANFGELQWENSGRGQLVRHAVVGGRTEAGEQLFVGRFHHGGAYTPGKIQPSHGVCYIPYGGEEVSSANYQILRG